MRYGCGTGNSYSCNLVSMSSRTHVVTCQSSSVRVFLVSYVGEMPWGGLYNASTKEERRKRKAKRRERSDQVH